MKPLRPLRLSAVITFGLVAILTMSAGLSWKERMGLIREIERLRCQMAYPVHPKRQIRGLEEEAQLVDGGTRAVLWPRG